MKIIILNLPRKATQDDLFQLFKPYGMIKSCVIVMDKETGTSKGFGFVEMTDHRKAAIAIKELNGHMIGDKRLRVKASDTPNPDELAKL